MVKSGKTYCAIRILPISKPSHESIKKWDEWSVSSETWTIEDCENRIYKYYLKNLESGFKFGIFSGFGYVRGTKGYKRIKWKLEKVITLSNCKKEKTLER